MLPEWLGGYGRSCGSARSDALRDGWLDGRNPGCGLPACRDCGAPVDYNAGCDSLIGGGRGCGTPFEWGRGYGAPFGWNSGYGAPFGWGRGCDARWNASNCSFGSGNCACGYRWCDCADCNPLGGFGDGPCGGYISYWDRYYGGC